MKQEIKLIRSRRKTISIEVTKDQRVIVRAPNRASLTDINRFIGEKADWIDKSLNRMGQLRQEQAQRKELSPQEVKLLVTRAKRIIPQRVRYFADLMGVTYGRITIRMQKSRWGSCSAQGNLNFNCLLVLMPPEVLDSVVVHELCHRRHMNHSRDFYDEVLRIFPDYKRCNKWLKQNGGAYFKRIEES